MALSVGIVKSVEGIAIDTNSQGIDRVLKVGDVVNVEDTIDTLGAGSKIVIALTDGQELSIGGNDAVFLDKSVYGAESFGNDAVASSEVLQALLPTQSVADIQQALLNGEDINNLPPTAAGDTNFAQMGTGGEAQYIQGGNESNVYSELIGSEISPSETILTTRAVAPDVNDAPIITSEAENGVVTEDINVSQHQTLNDNGLITFTDADFRDIHTARVSNVSDGALGTLELGAVNDDVNSPDGSVAWTYAVSNSNVQYLAVGETKIETFDIIIDDGRGGTDTQTVTVTITGTNDAPVLTVQNISAVEDGPTVTGTASFTDVDSNDTHTYSVTAMSDGEGSVSIDSSTGVYTYNPGTDFQYLAKGETKNVTFDVSVADNHGGTDTQTVTVTITGTNDAPVAVVSSGEFNEDQLSEPVVPAEGGENLLTGLIDVDTSDTNHFIGKVAVSDGNYVDVDDNGGTLIKVGFEFTNVQGNQETIFIPVRINQDGTYDVSQNELLDRIPQGADAVGTFWYKIDDGHTQDNLSQGQEFTISIHGQNDAPSFNITSLDNGDTVNDIPVIVKLSGDRFNSGSLDAPQFNILIDGQKLNDSPLTVEDLRSYRIDSSLGAEPIQTSWEYVTFNVANGTEQVEIQFIHDAWEGGHDVDGDGYSEDRNLIVDSINIGGEITTDTNGEINIVGGTTLQAEDTSVSTYTTSSGSDESGRETMPWTGVMSFDVADTVASAVPADIFQTETFEEDSLADATSVIEGTTNLLSGVVDIDGLKSDISVVKADGTEFTNPISVALNANDADGNPLTLDVIVNPDGTYYINPNSSLNALTEGVVAEGTFEFKAIDSNGGLSETQTFTVRVEGTNDAPIISGETDAVSVVETDASLSATGDFIVTDYDTTDTVTASVDSVVVSGTNSTDSSLPNIDALKAMLSVSPTEILNTTQEHNTLVWNFNSDGEAFDYLAVGETLVLTYTIKAIDSANTPLSDTQDITITIVGTNDQPEVSSVSSQSIDGQIVINGDTTTSVDYWDFTHNGGNFTVDMLTEINNNGNPWVQDGTGVYNDINQNGQQDSLDVMIRVYKLNDDGSRGSLVGMNDDNNTLGEDGSVWNRDSYLNIQNLPEGNYQLVVGAWNLEQTEVDSGYNSIDNARWHYEGPYQITMIGDHGVQMQDKNVVFEAQSGNTVFENDLPAITDIDTNDTHVYEIIDGSQTLVLSNQDGEPIDNYSIVLDSSGHYTLSGDFNSLAVGETATVTFKYVANDGHGFDGTDGINESSISQAATVTITVIGTNDASVAVNDAIQPGVEAGVVITGLYADGSDVNLLDSVSDQLVTTKAHYYFDHHSLGYTGYNYMGSSTDGGANDPGNHNWFADNGINVSELRGGVITFSDGTQGIIDTASNGITRDTDADGTNDYFESAYIYYKAYTDLNLHPLTTDENNSVTVDVLSNDTDVDNGDNPSTFSLDSVSTNDGGVVSIEDNKLHFDPGHDFDYLDDGEITTVVVDYTMSDDSGATSSATATIIVTGSNDAPTISVDPISGNVSESGLSSGTNPSDQNITASGTFAIDDGDGLDDISSIEVNETSFAVTQADNFAGLVNQTVTTTYGEIRIDSYSNGVFSYTYMLNSPVSNVAPENTEYGKDVIKVVASDGTQSSTGVITIDIGDDIPTITTSPTESSFELLLTNLDAASSAGYHNSFGYYVKDENGEPTIGKVVWDDVHDSDATTVTITGFTPDQIGFFIIPNGDNKNSSLLDGADITFVKDSNDHWQAVLADGTALIAANPNAPVLFDDTSLNYDADANAYAYQVDNSLPGNLNWEDIAGGGDRDNNDVNVNADWTQTGPLGVDESDLSRDASYDFSSSFNFNFGADGTASQNSIVYSLNLKQGNSGLYDTATNQEVQLHINNGVVEGYVDINGTEEIVFTLSLDANGVATLDQQRAVVHADPNNPDDSAGIDLGLIDITAAITDGDGDKVTSSIDIGSMISFDDDSPMAFDDTNCVKEDCRISVDGNVLANDFQGADTASVVAGTQSGAYGNIQFHEDGSYTYDLDNDSYSVQSLSAGEKVYETFNYTIIDKDGDSDTGALKIAIHGTNDAPLSEDFSLDFSLDTNVNMDFNSYVSDIEDDVSNSDSKVTMIEVTFLPEHGTIYDTNENEITVGNQYHLDDLHYRVESTQTILLGAKDTDTSLNSWGSGTNVSVVKTSGDISATTSSSEDHLRVYDHEAEHIGYGIADNDGNGINAGETITVNFSGGIVTTAEVGFDGLGSYFNPDSQQQAKATWTAYLDGNIVGEGELTNLGDGSIFRAETIAVSGGFDTLVFGNTEITGSGSNYEVRYVEANFAHNDSFTYIPVDADGSNGNESTVSLSYYDHTLSHGDTTDGFLIGGVKDDTITYDEHYQIDGKDGVDTLLFENDARVDLSSIADGTIKNIETLDLTQANVSISNLNPEDVLDMTDDNNIIKIDGDSGDTVSSTSSWTQVTDQSVVEAGYTRYQSEFTDSNNATHQVFVDIKDTIVHSDF